MLTTNVIDGPQFDYVNKGNPTIDVNPRRLYATWFNLTSGELFICTDISTGVNIWVGQLGKTVSTFDPAGTGALVSCYFFNDNLLDSLGVNDGIEVGTLGYSGVSKEGKSLTGFTSSNYMNTGCHVAGHKAVSMWIWVSSTASDPHAFGNYSNGSDGFSIGIKNGNWHGVVPGYAWSSSDTGVSVLLNQWNHIVLNSNYTIGNGEIFLNGSSIKIIVGSPTTENTYNFYVGGINYTGTAVYNQLTGGIVDVLRIYDRELSQTEVTKLFTEFD